MGNLLSSGPTREEDADNVKSECDIMNTTEISYEEKNMDDSPEDSNEDEVRSKAKEQEMNEFRKQLSLKREQRKEILARHRAEKEELERSLQREKAAKLESHERNKLLCELLTANNIDVPENLIAGNGKSELENTLLQMQEDYITIKSNNTQLRKDLAATNNALQNAYSDMADLSAQNTESIKQIRALKEVVSVSKTMLNLREEQLNELKKKLNDIERSLAERETNILSTDLRQEYERQLLNIRTLRVLYEERARLAEATRLSLIRELDEHKALYQAEVKKTKDLTDKVEELETKIDSLIDTIECKTYQISSLKKETEGLKAETAVVNKLFSQVLLGYKTKQDLDTLVHRLEENHGILTQMAERENGSEASSALPKLLLELISQVDETERQSEEAELKDDDGKLVQENEATKESELQKTPTTAEDIVENLPKVWKVLIELLSHQNASDVDSSEKITTCYKSVETASGPVLVPSVSQTYIRLKDLIIEKLGLIKEVNRMKQLNTHLETRLGEQERRLCLVTSELSKTWHVVGRLRRHHQQLHTHEKILKYELQQKRKLLNELKEELEYCREKCEQAREKNTQSERDWRKLRAEFSSRKNKAESPSFNNSGESGYSDERPSDDSSESNDESEYVAIPIRCKKKIKKSSEPIMDSSADINLAAEREDPVSDMLDVADLPLDTQESEESHGSTSETSKSESYSKNEKICEETEDEVADIAGDAGDYCFPEETCTEGPSSCNATNTIDDSIQKCNIVLSNITSKEPSSSISQVQLIDDNDRLQNNQSIMNNDLQIEFGNQINVIQDATTSSNECIKETSVKEVNQLNNLDEDFTVSCSQNITNNSHREMLQEDKEIARQTAEENSSQENPAAISTPDFKSIIENIRKQDERLAKKDQRLQKLEDGCTEVLKNISSTLNSGDKLITKLNDLHNDQPSHTNKNGTTNEISKSDSSTSDKEESEPSTSNDIDHEARFAARDLRLKRLEEQTKSLVNKVNKTNSKGIKIHYKLEELHNIYGSESSRAGTPSDECEQNNQENDSPDEN